jgi:hypothetical protein
MPPKGSGQLHLPRGAELAAGCGGGRRAQHVDQPQAGVSRHATTQASPNSSTDRRLKVPATLKVKQESFMNPLGIMRGTFDVVVDGKSVGSIKWHEAVETPIEPGRHTLQVGKGRYSSRVRTFDAAEDEAVAFRCNRRRHPLILAATLVAPSLAISLSRE